MAMSCSLIKSSHFLLLLHITTITHLFFLASCFTSHQQQSYFPRALLFEEKTRLGSTPPSCHNKCNRCHPCMAVQVPSLRSHDRIDPKFKAKAKTMEFLDPSSLSAAGSSNRYSNYKPLGWKCRCGDHFFNP